ncbi:hypothetical protein AB6A40_011448 [Gnathostoma spinigerum]|uniref:Uncharacterized protein n=1 Tax=Gnathostoma spinigerum TaxID=75299 RepID=A0ABD6F3D7_9BILA
MDETSRSIRSSSNHDAHSTAENTAGESPYSLRDHATSKPPTRFRDYDAAFPKEHSPSPAKQRRIRGYHSPIKHTATMRSDSSHPVVNVDDDTESSASGSSHPSNTVHLKDRREERPMFAIAHRDSHVNLIVTVFVNAIGFFY